MTSTGSKTIVQQMTSRFEGPDGQKPALLAADKLRSTSSTGRVIAIRTTAKKTPTAMPTKKDKRKTTTVVVSKPPLPSKPSSAAGTTKKSGTDEKDVKSRSVISQIRRFEGKQTVETKATSSATTKTATETKREPKKATTPQGRPASSPANRPVNRQTTNPLPNGGNEEPETEEKKIPAPEKRLSVVSRLVNRFEKREKEVRHTTQLQRKQLRKASDGVLVPLSPSPGYGNPRSPRFPARISPSVVAGASGVVKPPPPLLRTQSDSSMSPSPSRKSSLGSGEFPAVRTAAPYSPPVPTVKEERVQKEKTPTDSIYEDVKMDEERPTEFIYEAMVPAVDGWTDEQKKDDANGMTSLDGDAVYDDLDEKKRSDGTEKSMKDRPLPLLPPGGLECEPLREDEGGFNGDRKKSLFSRIKRRMAVKSSTKEARQSKKISKDKGRPVSGGSLPPSPERKPAGKKRSSYVEIDVDPDGGADIELKSEDETPEPEDSIYDDIVSAKEKAKDKVSIGGTGSSGRSSDGDGNDVYEDVEEGEPDVKRCPHSPKPEWAVKQFSSSSLVSTEDVKESSLDVPENGESLYESPADLAQSEDDLVVIGFADALWDYVTMETDELSFRAGEMIAITELADDDWWGGYIDDRCGWFPKNYVRMRITDGVEKPGISKKFSVRRKKLSPTEMRAKVLEEIFNTEKDYVSHLSDIVKGYVVRCRENPALFPPDVLQLVFCNVEELCEMHTGLLASLEESASPESLYDSCIGHCFVDIEEKFQAYSEYCNNHPDAVAKLGELQVIQNYKFFFEGCRLLQNMQQISLDGYLLNPVQKICKYPLQLSELLKTTPETHPDYEMVVAAKNAMKKVAVMINERKRRYEGLRGIAKWQLTIEGWEGEDVLMRSSDMIHSGELNKISKGRSQERKMFLFDNQLIYCKKELLGGHHFRGRLDMRNCEVIDLKDGEGSYGNTPVNNAWKMNNVKKSKWYILYTKTAEEKAQWMKAFDSEQARIEEDMESGFAVSKAKRQAIMSQMKKQKLNTKAVKARPLFKSATLNPVSTPTVSVTLPSPVSSADYGMGKTKKGRLKQRNKAAKRKENTS